jgi:pre-mRNA-processing factor 40
MLCFQLAREQAQKAVSQGTQPETSGSSHAPDVVTVSSVETAVATVSAGTSTTSTLPGVALSPVPVTPVVAVSNPSPVMVSGSPTISGAQSTVSTSAVGIHHHALAAATPPRAVSGSAGVPDISMKANPAPMYILIMLLKFWSCLDCFYWCGKGFGLSALPFVSSIITGVISKT